MTAAPSTLVGVFNDSAAAQRAVEALHNTGFSNNQLRYSGPAQTGGFWESIKSMFTDTGTTSSNMANDLMTLGLSQDEAAYCAREYEKGHPIVAVNVLGREQDAWQIFQSTGAQTYSAGSTSGAASASAYSQTAGATQTDQYERSAGYADTDELDEEGRRKLRLREERLQVEKQPVESGEVRLGKEVVTEQQSIDVPVSHEEVYVERRGFEDRPTDVPVGEGETFRVPVREEQVDVGKTTVETGEVTLGKRTVQETQRVSDTVRREEARVERVGDVPVRDESGNDIINNPNADPRNP